MIELDQLRREAASFPEVSEGTHFRLPSFKVRDKGFLLVEKGEATVLLSVDRATGAAAAADDPAAVEEVWRNDGGIFVGVRVDLARASWPQVQTLVDNAWRNKAPKRLAADHPPR